MSDTQQQFKGRMEFLDIVQKMRSAQKEFFATRTPEAKEKAMMYEKYVDAHIEKGDKALGERNEYLDRLYFFGIVKFMRKRQKQYFLTRDNQAMAEAKKYEAFVDAEIQAGDSWLQSQIEKDLFSGV